MFRYTVIKKMKDIWLILTCAALSGVVFCGCSADVEVDNSKSGEKRKSIEEAKDDKKNHSPTAEELLEAKRDKEE